MHYMTKNKNIFELRTELYLDSIPEEKVSFSKKHIFTLISSVQHYFQYVYIPRTSRIE